MMYRYGLKSDRYAVKKSLEKVRDMMCRYDLNSRRLNLHRSKKKVATKISPYN